MKVLDVKWFGNVGIARVDSFGEIKYYIKEVDGRNEEHDKQEIANWGSSFPVNAGDIMFGVASCLVYDDVLLYGNKVSLDFVSELIEYRERKAIRGSAQIRS